MQANSGHIIIPISAAERAAGEFQEYNRAKKVWKHEKNRRLPGRALVVMNLPFKNEKGETKTWNQLQVACQAIPLAKQHGYDVIRVQTPGMENEGGERAIASWDFSVRQLLDTIREDGIFMSEVMDGKINLEDDARNVMPYKWALNSDSHVWHPTV